MGRFGGKIGNAPSKAPRKAFAAKGMGRFGAPAKAPTCIFGQTAFETGNTDSKKMMPNFQPK